MTGVFISHFCRRCRTKWINVLIAMTLIGAGVPVQAAQGATVLSLPAPGTMVQVSQAREPALIKGLTVYPEHPLKFKFIIDRGDAGLAADVRGPEYDRLVKYFLAALTVPEKDLWVNLSPYERDRMSPEIFSQTEMGRDLLAQDYLLKQLTASLLYPEDDLGERFWQRVYQKAQALYGTTDIPVNTFNKVWIVPESAVVYESGASAFVAESRLKVMMEQDYLARNGRPRNVDDKDTIAAELIREIVIPEIEREVNEGEHFAQLRQMYYALILATWYKKALHTSLLGQIYVDRNKVKGVDIPDKEEKQKIYNRYLAAFRKGVYNYIKEDYDADEKTTVVRQYFSGGAGLQLTQSGVFKSTTDFAQLSGLAQRNIVSLIQSDPRDDGTRLENVLVDLREVSPATDAAMMAIERWRDDPGVEVLTGGRHGHVNDADEFIAVTDFMGRVMASRPKSEVHAGGLPHMSVNLYVYDRRGRLLFQRRSSQKRESGGKLQVSVSGHVDAGETPLAAVLRETKEEIGISLDEQRLTQITETNEVFRETPVSDGILRKFVTAYVYQINDTELAQVQNNYNLNEVMELWLISPDLFETMILEAPDDFSATVRELALSDVYSVYDRVLAQAPDSAQLAAPELRLLELVRQPEPRPDQALITAVERQKEIISQGYLGFDPVDPSDPPVWVRNVLEFYQATDPDSYEDLLGRLRGGLIRFGQDEKVAIDGFTTNNTLIIATNHPQYPEVSLIKLLDPEKAKENTDAYLRWTVRDSLGNLIGFTAGVIAPSVRAFAHAGIFELFVDGTHSPTMAGIERYLKAQGKNVNKGYLHGVLYTFAKLGWLTRSGRQANDEMSFTLTDKGKQILGAVAAYSKAADFDAVSLKLSWYLLDESPTGKSEEFHQILQELAALAARGWDLPANMDEELATEVRRHLNGFIVGPLLTVMRDRELNIIPMLLEKREIDLTKIAKNERGLSRLKAAFDMLANVGFVQRDGLRVRMTKKGEANFRRTLNYGVPVSYYPTYALVEELLFGNPAAVPRYTREGIETLVDRILNTDGSDKSHEGYFKKVKAEFGLIVEGMFDQQRIPTPEQMEARIAAGKQPFTFVVSDVGAGRGGFLLNMYDVIMNSEFGQLMRDYPDLYRVILVGIDFNRAARSNMSNNFGSRNIPHIILDGDIGKPQEILETMRVKFDELGVKADIMFNIRSMLDHNRQWTDVKDPAAAEAREPISTSVFAYRGELIPNNYLEQNLKEHFEGWAELADELLIIELHTLDEDVVAANLDKTLDIPYYVSHLFSDQYIVERPVFIAMAKEAGYGVKTLATYRAEEELATVGIYHFIKDLDLDPKPDQAMNAEKLPRISFVEHVTSSGQPMLWREDSIKLDEVIDMLSSGDNSLSEIISDARFALRDNLGLDEIAMARLPDYDGHDVQVAVLGKQPTNSFKPWIAYGILQEAAVNQNLEKIITSTTGNQGIAVAWVARVLSAFYGRKFEAVIYVGRNTPKEKLAEMEALGATIIGDPRKEPLYRNYDEAFDAAEAEAKRLGERAYYVYHADTAAIVSYSALGDAIVDRFLAEGHDLAKSAIFVPVGAGGLASGVAIAAKLRDPRIKVILVQTERTRHAYDSFLQGLMLEYVDDYAHKFDEDGIDTKSMEPLAYEILSRLADGLVMVDSTKIKGKIGFKKLHGIKAEGAAVIPYLAMEEIAAELREDGVEHILNVGTGSNISDLEVTLATLLLREGRLQAIEAAQNYPPDQVLNPGNIMVYQDDVSDVDLISMFGLSHDISAQLPQREAVIREEGKMLLAAKVSAFFGDPRQQKSFGHQLPLAIYLNQQVSFVNSDWRVYARKGPLSVLGVITQSYRHPKLEGKAEVTVRTMVVAADGELLLDGESRLLVNAGEQLARLPEKPRTERVLAKEPDIAETMVSAEMTITPALLEQMSAVFGDFNPVHQEEDPSVPNQYGIFKQRIAHGLLGGVLMAGFARGGRLFDNVSFDEQNFVFLKGVHVGDRVRVQTRVGKDIRKGTRRERILYSALEKKTGEKWERVIQGESILEVKDRAMIGEGKTAIVVDDQYFVAEGTELILRHYGFQTQLAGNGREALELIARMKEKGRQVDLVVTDKDMPEMAGEELVIRLKDEHPDIPVLMNTGDTTNLTALSARLEIPILAKPFSMNEMLDAITRILGDQALTATEQVGGIDFNPANMDFQIKRDPSGIPLPMDLQPAQFMQIEGFVPVILEISPVLSLPMLMGVLDRQPQNTVPDGRPLQPLAQGTNPREQLAGSPRTWMTPNTKVTGIVY